MYHNIKTGKKGEKTAVNYLINKGYKILETNWHHHHKEIDIIANDGNTLVIVEVKTRKNSYFGYPEQAVNKKKQQFLIEAANAYIFKNDIKSEVRFDVIAIIYEKGSQELLHIKDAFIPGL